MVPESSIFILLLVFEDNLKGITIDGCRDCKTLAMHYDTLSQRHPDVEFLGLK